MSFSFNFRAANKAAAKAQAEAEFDKVVAGQPVHSRDKAAALANVGNAIDLLVDDSTKDINVGVNGRVSWRGDDTTTPLEITGAAVQCSVGLIDRPIEAESTGQKTETTS